MWAGVSRGHREGGDVGRGCGGCEARGRGRGACRGHGEGKRAGAVMHQLKASTSGLKPQVHFPPPPPPPPPPQTSLLCYKSHLMQIFHEVLATRLQISNKRRFVADSLKVLQVQRAAGFPRHGQQMEDCIGAAPQGHDGGNGVFKSLGGHDVQWLDVTLQQLQQSSAKIPKKEKLHMIALIALENTCHASAAPASSAKIPKKDK